MLAFSSSLSLKSFCSILPIPYSHLLKITLVTYDIHLHDMPEEYAYRNGRPGRNTALPVQDYHATTPPEEYDLVCRMRYNMDRFIFL